MKSPEPGLRPLFNRSKSTQRVEILVAPGDQLEVSNDVAAQIEASSTAFVSPDAEDRKGAPPGGHHQAIETEADDTAEADEAPKKQAAKRPARKRS